ncbi:MAG: DUF3617 family protein [Rhizobacter sp.]
MRSRTPIIVFSLAVLAYNAQAQARPQGGQWEFSMSMEGGPMSGKKDTGTVCLANELLAFAPEKTLLDAVAQQTHRGRTPPSCEFQDMQRNAGTASWTSVCKGPMGEMKGSGSSTTDADAAAIQQRLIAKSPFGTFTFNQTVNARRLGNCT